MKTHLKLHLEGLMGKITQVTSLSGGDISSVYRLQTANQDYFVKVNNAPQALKMFEVEIEGLKAIAETQTINVPGIFHHGQCNADAFLTMDFIESRTPGNKDLELLGIQLARMHQISQEAYGSMTDNFIGSLQQSNEISLDWPSFYTRLRILPQIELAQKKGLLAANGPDPDTIQNACCEYLVSSYPSLIHGDLWAGNFLISSEGKPFLIDPAVYHGHHQVDIAMSQLFGGFGQRFYQAYVDQMDGAQISKPELDLYQLYYLLVHLNLFGSSYYAPVKRIFQRYF